jgi:hypothetical protein
MIRPSRVVSMIETSPSQLSQTLQFSHISICFYPIDTKSNSRIVEMSPIKLSESLECVDLYDDFVDDPLLCRLPLLVQHPDEAALEILKSAI